MSFVKALIGIMVAVLIGVTAVIPVISSAISDSNITGTTKTILDIVPIMLGIALLLGAVALFS